MYVINRERINTVLKIGGTIVVSLYGFYLILIFTLVGISSTANTLTNYSNYIVSQILYTFAFIISFTAIISSQVLNKKKWPMVEGHIMNSDTSLNSRDLYIQQCIKFSYLFDYRGLTHIKRGVSKLTFRTEAEAQTYVQKHTIDPHATIPIYVFKFYPNWSSTNTKMNIMYLFYVFIVVVTNALLILFGFIFRIAGAYDLTTAMNSSNSQASYQVLHNIFTNYLANFDLTALIVPLLLLVVLILFLVRSLYLLIQNRISFFNSSINPDLFMEEFKFQRLTERHCDDCNTVNDLESIFCSNCGKKLQ